jgi:hypothetical protein
LPILGGAALLALTGCIGMVADAGSTAATGKGVTDHALSAATGEDCNLVEGATRKDRDICEPEGSAPTKKDFKGLGKDGDEEKAPARRKEGRG